MKTNEEINAIRNEIEAMGRKLAELTEDELLRVTGGTVVLHNMPQEDDNKYVMSFSTPTNDTIYNFHIYTGARKE